MTEATACAECGHLHFLGRELGYCECPIEECECMGQPWALNLEPGRSWVEVNRAIVLDAQARLV